MPVKVHVKGKRKAPLPPTSAIVKPIAMDEACASSPANPIENVKKKSLAPQPPLQSTSRPTKHLDIVSKIDMNVQPNNLSSASTKQTDKKYETKTIFNIVEPKHIQNNLRSSTATNDEPILTKFTSDFVNVYNGNGNADANGTREIWDCEHCTLENPFWKIVCSACDRIRPYGLPTRIVSNNKNSNFAMCTNDAMPSTSTTTPPTTTNDCDVKLRRKASIGANNFDTLTSKRSSINGDIQPYAVGPTNIELIQKIDNTNTMKKRTSMIVAKDNDYTVNTLEMEKQRLRAVIRSMNNRALAEKYPIEKPNNLDIAAAAVAAVAAHKYETLNLDVNKLEKNCEKVLNGEFGALGYENLRLTDDAKAKANHDGIAVAHVNGERVTGAKPKNTTYYDFIGNLTAYCDQQPLGGTIRKLEKDIRDEKPKKNAATEASNMEFIDEMPIFDLP